MAYNFHYLRTAKNYTPRVRLFFVEKKKPKIFLFKNVMERRKQKNAHFGKTLNYI